MVSCIYECSVMHRRLEQKKTHFNYRYFMFYLDLDEIDSLSRKMWFLSVNKWNLFSLRDRDHLAFQRPGIKENVHQYLRENGVEPDNLSIRLLTNTAVLGYNFNPVSFYFCFDKSENPVCVVPEVGNTFGELKPYFIGNEYRSGDIFRKQSRKNFYVSPFITHDVFFDFKISIPGQKLNIQINDYRGQEKIFISHLSGNQRQLSDGSLIKFAFKYPFVTLKVIILIHYQALKLLISGLHFFRKNEFKELQIGAIQKWKK